MADPDQWQMRSPGDLHELLPSIDATPVAAAVERSTRAFPDWAARSLDDRIEILRGCQSAIRDQQEDLALSIARETGKPLKEARGELGAVVAKFDLTIEDANTFLADRPVCGGPHPALVRNLGRGPAAVIAPFNFPIHLGHGAAVAYLLAGNSALYKPSPLAAVTGAAYVRAMQSALPSGVMEVVQGWGETGRALCVDPAVRSVCFTGSVAVGTAIAQDLAADYSKSLALELGGKNASFVLDDADVPSAASAIADSFCLTTGQRCNATSRILVASSVLDSFLDALRSELGRYQPGDPLDEKTTLGPLVAERAVDRYRALTSLAVGEWIVPGHVRGAVSGKRGHYVTPAVILCKDTTALENSPLHTDEAFCPVVVVCPVDDDQSAIRVHNSTPYGLTASIFTASRDRFETLGRSLRVGNLYQNLPTTFSPSTLPFGGLGISGNGKPGGRGFVRFCSDEQAIQWPSEVA